MPNPHPPESPYEWMLYTTVYEGYPFRDNAAELAVAAHRVAMYALLADPRVAGKADVKAAILEHM